MMLLILLMLGLFVAQFSSTSTMRGTSTRYRVPMPSLSMIAIFAAIIVLFHHRKQLASVTDGAIALLPTKLQPTDS